MAILNINSLFAEKKAATAPVVKVPRNVKEMLCLDKVYENGIFKVEPGGGRALYDMCYVFEDINYKNQDEDKKDHTLLQVMKWLKSMDTQFKITLANEQRDMDKFMQEVFSPLHEKEYPKLLEGVGKWIYQKVAEGTRDIRRMMYLTVTCRAKSLEEAKVYFATLDTSLHMMFAAMGSRIYRMSGVERLLVLQRILRLGETGISVTAEDVASGNWKSQILPAVLEQDYDCMRINARYAAVLFAHDYEQTLNEEHVLHSLTDTLFPTYITLDIEPVRKRILKERLTAAHTNNERAIAQERTRALHMRQFGAETSYSLAKKKQELEGMLNQVDDNDEEAVFLGFLVLVPADSIEELEQRTDTLKQIAASNGYTLEPYYHRQLKALNTVLPIGGRQVNHMRSLLTSSAVAFQPFFARDLQDRGGFIYGLNCTTKHLLVGNRKKLKAPHGIVVGHTGGGKTFFVCETEIVQALLLTDDDIIVLDPKNELEPIIREFYGQYFDFTPQCQIHLNPFEVPVDVWEGDDRIKKRFAAKKTEFAVSFATAVMTNILVTQVHMNYIGRAVRDMYEAYFAQKKYHCQPTLKNLRELLRQEAEKARAKEEQRMVLDIVDCLEEYTEGAYDMFAYPSNLDIHHRLVGFGLKNIPQAAWEPVMITVMHFLASRIEHNQEELVAARLLVDETQVLCDKGSSADQLLYAVETYRSVGAVVTLIIQNLTRALENPQLRDMFSNCPFKCFLDQGGVDAINLARVQEFSEIEYKALEEEAVGRGVLVWDKKVYLFDARMDEDNPLYERFNTDFHKKAEAKRQQEEQLFCGEKQAEAKRDLEGQVLSLLSVSGLVFEELAALCRECSGQELHDALKRLVAEGKVKQEGAVFTAAA